METRYITLVFHVDRAPRDFRAIRRDRRIRRLRKILRQMPKTLNLAACSLTVALLAALFITLCLILVGSI